MSTTELKFLVSVLLESLEAAGDELATDIGIAISLLQHEIKTREVLIEKH